MPTDRISIGSLYHSLDLIDLSWLLDDQVNCVAIDQNKKIHFRSSLCLETFAKNSNDGGEKEGPPQSDHPRRLRGRKDLPHEPVRQQEVFQPVQGHHRS